jgi:hypothetical protein
MPIELIIQLYLNCELRTANCELFSRRSSKRYQVRRWHLKNFFDNPPQHLKKRIASIDSREREPGTLKTSSNAYATKL